MARGLPGYLEAILDAAHKSGRSEREISRIATGQPTALATIKNGRMPSTERTRLICEALGLEFYVGPPRNEAESIMRVIASALGLPADATVEEVLKAIEARREPEISALRGYLRSAEEDLGRITDALNQALRRAVQEVVPGPFSGLDDADALTRPSVSDQVLEFPDAREAEAHEQDPTALCSDGFRILDRLRVRSAAGGGAHVDDETVVNHLAFREEWLLRYGINYEKANIIEVLGKSMEPTLPDGSLILVDHRRTTRRSNRIFVVRWDDLLYTKRLVKDGEDWLLVSDNEEYTPVPWPKDAVVIGQVMWTGRTLA